VRLFSTPRSWLRSEPTALALLEAGGAVALTLAVTVRLAPEYVIASCSIVPFALMRTPQARRAGQWIYRKRHDSYEERWGSVVTQGGGATAREIFVGASAAFRFALYMIWLRVYLVIRDIKLRPLEMLRAVPENWRKIVLATDLMHAPEIIPGQEVTAKPQDVARLAVVSKRAWELVSTARFRIRILVVLLGIPFFAVAFAPAWLFRWTVKSTAIVWLGCLWGARFSVLSLSVSGKIRDRDSVLNLCRALIDSPFRHLSLGLSFSIIMLVSAKVIGASINIPREVWGSETLSDLLIAIIRPTAVPPWQWASFIASFCTIIAYGVCLESVWRAKHFPGNQQYRPQLVLLGLLGLLTHSLRGYTMLAVLYLLWYVLSDLNLPPLGDKLLPTWNNY